MPLQLRLAFRDWDFLTPLLLGDVTDPRLDLTIDRLGTMPGNPSETADYDGAEVSLSRFVQARIAGHSADVALPTFPMRAFRHRCVITRNDHPARRLSDLAGARIGVTGWQDSGNTWTRHALMDAGISIKDVHWFAGRLTEKHPSLDRLGRFGSPGWIDPIDGDTPMLSLLEDGRLDAVFTPFMPEGFFSRRVPFRPVLDDIPAAEKAYFDRHGFVPGLHLLALRAETVEREPWLPAVLCELLDEAHRVWIEKRRRYADTSPWLFDELLRSSAALPEAWASSGLDENSAMLRTFVSTAREQGLLERDISPEDILRGGVPGAGKHYSEEQTA